MQRIVSFVCAACIFAACSSTQPAPDKPANAPASTSAMQADPAAGYLSASALPASLSFVPSPPMPGSAANAHDEDVNRSALAMIGTPRWELATRDSVLTFPAVAQTFSCALNIPISEERTPRLIALLRRTLRDAGRAPYDAKQRYQRARPFMSNGKPICTPDREAALRRDGSYPSGHAAIGWAFGMVLSEVSPDRTNALIARGREFGKSRLVCNVHWPSDVLEGQMVGSAVVARLNAEASFRSDVAAARAEVEALRVSGATTEADCAAEAEALNSWR